MNGFKRLQSIAKFCMKHGEKKDVAWWKIRYDWASKMLEEEVIK